MTPWHFAVILYHCMIVVLGCVGKQQQTNTRRMVGHGSCVTFGWGHMNVVKMNQRVLHMVTWPLITVVAVPESSTLSMLDPLVVT